jgi:hypothetical protein
MFLFLTKNQWITWSNAILLVAKQVASICSVSRP